MTLAECNNLNRTGNGILVPDGHESINYSDGEATEEYLRRVLQGAGDLSSTSMELEGKIKDWPTEYHLSCRRANLFRGLNLSSRSRVLELGCGCGAITRYLGEANLLVDAVEGSRERAEIAAMRCGDLKNVQIVSANFNQLQLPAQTYDLIAIVGVLEYAGRFWPSHSGEEEATVNILKTIRQSLTDNGVIAIAIENRTGLKYVLGAHEDHYVRRYVGIDGYPNSTGVKTYTRSEWASLFRSAGISESRFLFPFPDYKLPTLVMTEGYSMSEYGYTHLEGIASRDYTVNLDPGVYEPVFWQAASANGSLGEFANSFLMLVGDDAVQLDEIANFDFMHLPDFRRRQGFNTIVRKNRGSDMVERIAVTDNPLAESVGLSQSLPAEPLVKGKLLSIVWSRSLLSDPWAEEFKGHLRQYYAYLDTQPLSIDLIPRNIVINDSGEMQSFDQEWEVDYELSREFVLFRALLLFGFRYKSMLGEFARRCSVRTVREFVHFGFMILGIEISPRMSGFVDKEERFQVAANEIRIEDSVHALLAARIGQDYALDPVVAKVYWRQSDQDYSEDRTEAAEAAVSNEVANLVFTLPADVSNICRIRFDPSDERCGRDLGFLQIYLIRVTAIVNGNRQCILELSGGKSIAQNAALSGIIYGEAEYGEVFAVTGDNPEVELDLTGLNADQNCSHYRVEVRCTHIRSTEFQLVRERFLVQEEVLRRELNDTKKANVALADELAQIKESKFWKVTQRYRSLLTRRA